MRLVQENARAPFARAAFGSSPWRSAAGPDKTVSETSILSHRQLARGLYRWQRHRDGQRGVSKRGRLTGAGNPGGGRRSAGPAVRHGSARDGKGSFQLARFRLDGQRPATRHRTRSRALAYDVHGPTTIRHHPHRNMVGARIPANAIGGHFVPPARTVGCILNRPQLPRILWIST